jgi:hypothetical protein
LLADPLQCVNDLIVVEQGSQTVERCLAVPWSGPGIAEDAARFLKGRDDSFMIVHGRELRCPNAAPVAHDKTFNREIAVWFRGCLLWAGFFTPGRKIQRRSQGLSSSVAS